MRFAYLGFNLFILVPCLVISLLKKAGPTEKWRNLLVGYGVVSVIFIVWDILASAAGHWSFSSQYTLSSRILGLPFEEYLFFFTVPFGCMLVWDGVAHIKQRAHERLTLVYFAVWALLSCALLITNWDRGYTRLAALSVLVTSALLLNFGRGIVRERRFMLYQLASLALFVVFNLYLTALPVIIYGEQAVTGWRFITIPIEDFFFNFALLNSFVLVYEKAERSRFINYVLRDIKLS